MGGVKRILASKTIEPPEKSCKIELCETVHFHMPGFRFELTAQEFDVFARAVQQAFEKWVSLGKPETAEFIPLAGGNTPNETVYPTRFEVEEQAVIPFVHIHVRGLSLRLCIPEFKMFVSVIEEAHKKLE